MSAGHISLGLKPICASKSTRRGEAEASTNLGALERPATVNLFETVGNTAFGQVVRSHFHCHLVTRKDTDTVLTHTPRRMGNDLMIIDEFHAKRRIGEELDDFALKLQ
jgi:diadenosine tetraphosphate (Ap4A) HIT family hydrolase